MSLQTKPKDQDGELSIILVTYPSDKDYVTWCRSIVDRRLAACINILNCTSIYTWEEKTETSNEVLLIFKTSKTSSPELKNVIAREHPYQVPEIVEISVVDVNKPYLSWVLEST